MHITNIERDEEKGSKKEFTLMLPLVYEVMSPEIFGEVARNFIMLNNILTFLSPLFRLITA